MQFNPDPKKKVEQVNFSKKAKNKSSLSLIFSNAVGRTCPSKKHLGLILDEWLIGTRYGQQNK